MRAPTRAAPYTAIEEPPVVAGQDRHPVAALDAHRQQAVGDGVGGVVEFGEGHLAVVVDDGDAGRACGAR